MKTSYNKQNCSAKLRDNANVLLKENYRQVDHDLSIRDWIVLESESDPMFFAWLFPGAENCCNDYPALTNEQRIMFNEFLLNL